MINKISLLFLSLFTLIMSYAQDKKFEFVVNVYPNYSVGKLSDDGSTPTSVGKSIKFLETWKPSLSSTFSVEYAWTEKSKFGIGLGFQNCGERTRKIDLIFGSEIFPGNTPPDPSLPEQSRFVYNHYNIEIPIYHRYVFRNKFFTQVGLNTLLNVSNTSKSVQYFEDGSVTRSVSNDNSTDFRILNLSASLGFGLDYFKTEKLTFYMFPQIQYGILGISKSAPINRNFLLLGLSTGIRL